MRVTCSLDEQAIRAAGGQVVGGGTGVRVHGWEITCAEAPITLDAEVEVLKDRFSSVGWPEQYFGANHLTLRHVESGALLRFAAQDAMQDVLQSTEPPVHVKAAARWMQAHEREAAYQDAKVLQYDWTYTTGYRGSTEAGDARWEDSGDCLNRELLTARDPILMYADIPLYESELEDNGIASLSVKVRVMPRCWYVLLRFWLRVDGVMVRLRTSRVFCAFENSRIVQRETTFHEGSLAALARAGIPPGSAAYADADSLAAALSAIAPAGVKLHERRRLTLGPGSGIVPA